MRAPPRHHRFGFFHFAGRHAWLHLAHGAVVLNGHALTEGDGAAVSDEEVLAISAETDAELLLFDLA